MMTEAERLAAYDRMYADLLKERDKVLADMDKLREACTRTPQKGAPPGPPFTPGSPRPDTRMR